MQPSYFFCPAMSTASFPLPLVSQKFGYCVYFKTNQTANLHHQRAQESLLVSCPPVLGSRPAKTIRAGRSFGAGRAGWTLGGWVGVQGKMVESTG